MALLSLLADLRAQLDIELLAAHFDHGLRQESAADAERVRRWASRFGVECRVGRAPPARASQAALRELRYEFLLAEVERTGSRRVATAHHADDQAETVLFRLIRGTGLRGLGGIPARRGCIARPLLPFRRVEIEAYVRQQRIPFLRDPSNRDPRWTRARLRHSALPALERSWRADPAPRLQALAQTAARADRALDDLAWRVLSGARLGDDARARRGAAGPSTWRFDAERLVGTNDELLARALRRLARRAGARLRSGGTAAGVQFIKTGRSGAEIDLGGGLRMWREFATLTIGTPSRPVADRSLVVTLEAHAAGVLLLGDRRFDVEWTSGEGPVAAHRDGESVFVPNEFLRHPLELRARRPGDNIRLAAGSRTLKKLFIDSRVPKTERQSVPVLACGQTVLWVYGLAVAEGVETGESGRASGPGIRVQIRPTAAASVRRTGICSVYRG